MQVTVTCTSSDVVFSLEISPDIELENFKVLVQVESGVEELGNMVFFHNGRILVGDKKTLKDLGVVEKDVLLFGPLPQGSIPSSASPPQRGRPISNSQQTSSLGGSGIDWSSIRVPGGSTPQGAHLQTQQQQRSQRLMDNPERARQMLLADPHQLYLLKERNPKLADAIYNPAEFAKILEQQQRERQEQERARIRLLTSDPFDLEAQRQIAEEIRMENVNQNMETAMEHNPEAFAEVYMLYINCKVNGHPVKAFVDSGAQMTIMSKQCAERCNVMRLIDYRWQGTAVGVGQQKIIGRIHMGDMQIEDLHLPTSYTILEKQPMDILLGLDMLKRHQNRYQRGIPTTMLNQQYSPPKVSGWSRPIFSSVFFLFFPFFV